MGNSEYILNCEGISKAFGGTQALKDVQLHVKPGEVHALLGENGAGKSTLMKCVIGLIKQDAGTMEFEGKPYQAKGPVDALNSGISMIHQELNPEPHLTVAESIFLKRENIDFNRPFQKIATPKGVAIFWLPGRFYMLGRSESARHQGFGGPKRLERAKGRGVRRRNTHMWSVSKRIVTGPSF